MPRDLIAQVLKTVRNYEMIKAGDTVLAAVSGGPDSVFLLHGLCRLKNKLKIRKIVVCNLDHGLRGKESKDDSLFVKRLADILGLDLIHKKIKLDKKKAKGLSTEEIARQARYEFFQDAAGRIGANVVATGHTLDDQAETVLMRFIRGSAFKGMLGISPKRESGAFLIVRPLLELEKEEISRYLDDKGVSYRIDRTNLEDIYFRNVVRREIIPFLEKYNPRLKRALFNLSEHLREDFQFIKEARSKAKGLISPSGKAIEIRLKDIAVQPKAIQKEILRDALEKAGGEVKRLSFRHWKEIESLIRDKRKGSSVDLPGSIRIMRTETSLLFRLI